MGIHGDPWAILVAILNGLIDGKMVRWAGNGRCYVSIDDDAAVQVWVKIIAIV